MPYTCKCGKACDLGAALDALAAEQMGRAGMFVYACYACGEKTEACLGAGRVEFGYSYWAGGMHWNAMQEVRLRGLKITRSDPDDIDVVLGDRQWHFGIRQLSRERVVVFQQAFAVGQRLGDLDFAQWNVAVTSVERRGNRLEPHAELLLAADDFITLAGPSPALVRAWHYLNDGKSRQR